MATSKKVVDSSYRVGCGRYIQENGASAFAGREASLLHMKKPLVIGTRTPLSIVGDTVGSSLRDEKIDAEIREYKGYCTPGTCEKLADEMRSSGMDGIIGIGGGHIMDIAKQTAKLADVPVINMPTSSATCAACTPLSVMYTEEYHTIGTYHHPLEVSAVIADTAVIARQPVRLLVSGALDAMAKYIELRQRLSGDDDPTADQGLLSSYALSRYSYETLDRLLPEAIRDTENGVLSKAVEDVIYLSIALTGNISGLARGSNQSAIAHRVYYCCRTLYPAECRDLLHGEIVAIGLIAQLHQIGWDDRIPWLKDMLKTHGIPLKLSDAGVPAESIDEFYRMAVESTSMEGTTDEEKARLYEGYKMIF